MSVDLANQILDLRRRIAALEALELPDSAAVAYAPTYLGAVPGVTTYTTQTGWYWRFGSILFVTGLVVWTAATGTGNAQIGLPLAPSALFGFRASGSLRITTVTFTTTTPELLLAGASAFLTLESPVSNAAGNIVQMEAAGNITFSLFYGVD